MNKKQKIHELKCYKDDDSQRRVSFMWTLGSEPDSLYFIDLGFGKTEKEAYIEAGKKLTKMAEEAFEKANKMNYEEYSELTQEFCAELDKLLGASMKILVAQSNEMTKVASDLEERIAIMRDMIFKTVIIKKKGK